MPASAPCPDPPLKARSATPRAESAWKLRLFNAFGAPELRQAIAALALRPGMRRARAPVQAQHAGYALRRPDFHLLQSLTLAVGTPDGSFPFVLQDGNQGLYFADLAPL